MRSRIFPPEIIKYLSDNAGGKFYKDLTLEVNTIFNTNYKTKQIKNFCINNKILTGTQRELIPEIIKKYITENYKTVKSWVLLTENINKIYGTSYKAVNIKVYSSKILKLKLDLDNGRGKNLEIHSEAIKEGCIYIKIDNKYKSRNKNWVKKNRYIWEQAHGKIPNMHKIIYLDNNPLNCTLENLAIVENAELCTMNGLKLKSTDPALTQTGIAIAKLGLALNKRMKEVKHE